MRNTDYFKDKKVAVVGIGRSGLACANLLYDLGIDVSVTENQNNDSISSNVAKIRAKNIEIEIGRHTQDFIKGRDLIIVSPGIPDTALPIIWARQFKIPIISEIELAWILCPATVIAVTGSNGKTTVTTLISKILEAKGERVFVCGNIGNPFSGEVQKMLASDFVALEVSSFQLEKIQAFKPKVSVILNFAYNHLDRYKDLQEYLKAKKRIFMNQDKSDFLVLNNEDPIVKNLSQEAGANIVYFSQRHGLNPNQAAVLAIGSIFSIKKEICLKVFREFKGIEHRLEYVTEVNNVTFVNDSKSTTADSTLWALKNISSPVILIAGGKDKGVDYSVILEELQKKARGIILIGEARGKIKNAFRRFLSIDEAPTLEEAVRLSFSKAKSGDYVLLSPMCSSFDMFSNYEERGRVFKKAVYDLAAAKDGS